MQKYFSAGRGTLPAPRSIKHQSAVISCYSIRHYNEPYSEDGYDRRRESERCEMDWLTSSTNRQACAIYCNICSRCRCCCFRQTIAPFILGYVGVFFLGRDSPSEKWTYC